MDDILKFVMPLRMHVVVLTKKIKAKYILLELLPLLRQVQFKYWQQVMMPNDRGGRWSYPDLRLTIRRKVGSSRGDTRQGGRHAWWFVRANLSDEILAERTSQPTSQRICEVNHFWFGFWICGRYEPSESGAFLSFQALNECLADHLL